MRAALDFTATALFPRTAFDLVAIAGSAGGIPALKRLTADLPADFAAPIAVVQHISSVFQSALPQILGYRSRLDIRFAQHGDRLRAGAAFIAPPDRHLLVQPRGRCVLEDSERVCFVRPSADRLFTSAAESFGPRVLAVVLSGMGRDGANGVRAVREHGGEVLVQDPADAESPMMPEAAIATGCAGLVLPLDALANALVSLVMVRGARALLGVRKSAA